MMRGDRRKNIIIVLIIALILTLSGCGKKDNTNSTSETVSVAENASNTNYVEGNTLTSGDIDASTNMDVVVLMDTSGSMLASDKDRIAIEAAKLFVDMEKSIGINLSIVEFSNKIKTDGMVTLSDNNKKKSMKKVLNNIEYVNNAYTDTGKAMEKAVSILDSMNDENKKAIILFTDGRTEITENNSGRTTKDSKSDLKTAVKDATSKEYTIYAVGLNQDNKVDKEELKEITSTTGGKAKVADNVSDLIPFFNDIFKDLGNIEEIELGNFKANGSFQTVDIPIENDNILEANVVILSQTKIKDIQLYNPSKKKVSLKGNDVVYTSSAKYSLVKLLFPKKGTWSIKVKGVSGDKIKVSLLYNYDINMISSISTNTVKLGDKVEVTAYLATNGSKIRDIDFYNGIKAVAKIKKAANGEESKINLKCGADGFSGELPIDTISNYEVQVSLSGQGLYRDSETFLIKTDNKQLQKTADSLAFTLRPGNEENIVLSDYFTDPDNMEIKYSISTADDSVATGTINKDKVVIKGISSGNTKFSLTAEDSEGSKQTIEISVKVKSMILQILPFIFIILLVGMIYLFIQLRKKMGGYFEVSLMRNENGKNTTFSFPSSLSANEIAGGKKFNLNKLITAIQGRADMLALSSKDKNDILIIITGISNEMKNIVINPTSKKDMIQLKLPSSKQCVLADFYGNENSGDKRKEVYSAADGKIASFAVKIKRMDANGNEVMRVLIQLKYKWMA